MEINNSNEDLTNKIKFFLENNKNNPSQKTEEWYEFRKKRIGGSEMHYICNLKPTNITTFINGFLKGKIERKNMFIPQCQFGILFENEINHFTKLKFNTEIYEIGVVQYDKINNISYSPDGVGIIDNKIVLFEFKCPFSRVPDKEIKFDYKCQINTGLNVISMCEKCYYCECEFKKCSLNDLYTYDKFDFNLHNIKLNRDFTELYQSYGIVYFYQETEYLDQDFVKSILCKKKMDSEAINVIFEFLITNDYDTNYDIGKYNKYWFFNNFLNKLHTGEYKPLYYSDLVKSNKITTEFVEKYSDMLPFNLNRKTPNPRLIYELQSIFKAHIKDMRCKIIGFLPWKLYNYNVIIQEKNLNFFDERLKNKISHIGCLLNDISSLNSVKEKTDYIMNKKPELENMLRST